MSEERPRTAAGTFAAVPAPLSSSFLVRCTPEQRSRYKRAAKRQGLTLGAYVRWLLDGAG